MDTHFAIAVVVVAWAGGFGASTVFTLGLIEAITGRMAINPRRLNWSAGEVRVRGAVFATAGVLLAIFFLINVLALMASWYHYWDPPAWWFLTYLAGGPIGGMAPIITLLLLEQHHNKRWPFNGSRTEASLD